jgi:predicted ATPase
LGKDDTWVVQESTQFAGFERRQLEQKFSKEFEILWMDELKGYKPLANGTLKFWHFHTLILKKKK